MRILNASQMHRIEEQLIQGEAIASLDLMERAGQSAFDIIQGEFRELKRAVVLCGRGSNGGDGWIVGRLLHECGVEVDGVSFGRGKDLRGDTRAAFDRAASSGVRLSEIVNEAEWERWLQGQVRSKPQKESVSVSRDRRTIVIDALVGTGLNRPLAGLLAAVARDINHSDVFDNVPVVAIDIPSGFASDSICQPGPTVDATLTVTFGVPKYPCVMGSALSRVGKLVIANIGLTDLAKYESGMDKGLSSAAYDAPTLIKKIKLYTPSLLAFTGKRPASIFMLSALEYDVKHYGEQPVRIGPTRIFVLPSPSGAARRWWSIKPWLTLANNHRLERGER